MLSRKVKTKRISAMDYFCKGVVYGMGLDSKLWKGAPSNAKEWLSSFKGLGETLFKNKNNNLFDKEGNYRSVDILKLFAEKGHPENKRITAMAKKFKKNFGNVPMKNWKLADNPKQKTLLPADKNLHEKYKNAVNKFDDAWYRDSKKGGWYIP